MSEASRLLCTKHFDGKRFRNPDSPQARGLRDLLRWKLTTRPEPSPAFVDDVKPTTPPERIHGDQLRCTLINHSTVLLQQGGSNILTDPIWAARASPLSWAGPRRRRQPGVLLEDLPPIDLVLLSHNHYDHLDLLTLRQLSWHPHCTFIVPAGVGQLLRSENIQPVYELDWGESRSIGNMTIHAVPAIHFSGRSLFDRNRTLWCGYMIESRGQCIYFAGDTGFGSHFSHLRAVFGSPRLSLLPIGAYEPRWFMSPIHMSPAEAVQAHEILESRASIATHHGTFQLADEGLDTPAKELTPPASFIVLKNGQSADIA